MSPAAASLLNLSADDLASDQFLAIFSGNSRAEGGHFIAQVYAGHQFGHYVPQLGDGRAIFIGEAIGQNNQQWDIQLKGAGLTPYSRMGDGRAVLRSSIREFLASEAMAALAIPSTRALALIGSDEPVYRESVETGAMLTRLARSHLRFGHFEYLFHAGKQPQLQSLMDFCLSHFFADCQKQDNPYQAMLTAIVERTAKLIAHWQAVGFCHGVMNTDNMSILGDTLDYGPFAFMDDYNPQHICNHSDHQGRYRFDNQPSIGLWNLNALAYTFSTHLSVEQIRSSLATYEPTLVKHYQRLMMQKLGFRQWGDDEQMLLQRYLTLMQQQQSDYSLSFRYLANLSLSPGQHDLSPLLAIHQPSEALNAWVKDYLAHLQAQAIDDEQRRVGQNQVNPLYILRNHLAQTAIEQAQQGNYAEITILNQLLSQPFTEQPGFATYSQPAPQWGKSLVISCSS